MEILVPLGCYLYSARKVDNTGYSSLISNAHNLKNYILITMTVVIGVYCSRWRNMALQETVLFYPTGPGSRMGDLIGPRVGTINCAPE